MTKKLIQSILAFLRWFHLDVYEILKNRAERRMWRRALPKDGRLDEMGLCVAVPLRAFNSVGQVGRDFARRLAKTSVPFELSPIRRRRAGSSRTRSRGLQSASKTKTYPPLFSTFFSPRPRAPVKIDIIWSV